MKKLLSVSAMALVLLAGCSSTTSYAGQTEPSTEEGHEGEYTTVTFDKTDDGDITNTQFDVVLPEGEYSTTSKKELSNSGEYGMAAKTGKSWTQHVNELEAYVDENDAMPAMEEVEQEDGETKLLDVDGASGATIGLDSFNEAFLSATATA